MFIIRIGLIMISFRFNIVFEIWFFLIYCCVRGRGQVLRQAVAAGNNKKYC